MMAEKVYRGYRIKHQGAHVTVTSPDKPHEARKLRVRLDLWNHSPDGFNWGYGGAGPAQLALALLADALGDDDRARRLHQKFKWKIVARLDGAEPWELTESQIRASVDEVETSAAANGPPCQRIRDGEKYWKCDRCEALWADMLHDADWRPSLCLERSAVSSQKRGE